jgi:molybdenum cofactor cytidylyltransferase
MEKSRSPNSIPLYELADQSLAEDHTAANIHGIVLAAGASKRYGERNKLLESTRGSPLVWHAVATLQAACISAVSVVIGHQSQEVKEAIESFDVAFIDNSEFAGGQSKSLQKGVAHVQQQGADAVVIALGDMPEVSVESINRLITAYTRGVGDAVAAACDGIRGNPVLFDKSYFDGLMSVSGDKGGQKVLFEANQPVLIETGDQGVLSDVDNPGDIGN